MTQKRYSLLRHTISRSHIHLLKAKSIILCYSYCAAIRELVHVTLAEEVRLFGGLQMWHFTEIKATCEVIINATFELTFFHILRCRFLCVILPRRQNVKWLVGRKRPINMQFEMFPIRRSLLIFGWFRRMINLLTHTWILLSITIISKYSIKLFNRRWGLDYSD